jgi:hypothetical protein
LEPHAPGTTAYYCPKCKVFPDHCNKAINIEECAPFKEDDDNFPVFMHMKKSLYVQKNKVRELQAIIADKNIYIDHLESKLQSEA